MLTRWFVVLFIGLLAGCAPRAEVELNAGDVLLRESFDTGIGWENRQSGDVSVGVEQGQYVIRADVPQYVRGFYVDTYDDVIIDMAVTQRTQTENNGYGLICRGTYSDSSANGYYFLIGGDGTYSIRKGVREDVNALIAWTTSSRIKDRVNEIRAVCVGDYLALWVNGELVAQIRDDTYQSGRVGLVATTAEGTTLEVAFDNLVIAAGRLASP